MPVSLEWLYGQYSAHNNVVERFLACARTRLPLSIYIYIYISHGFSIVSIFSIDYRKAASINALTYTCYCIKKKIFLYTSS